MGLSFTSRFAKRLFDILLSFTGLVLSGWLIVLAISIASIETRCNGLFSQVRVGRNGKLFTVYKIRTMYAQQEAGTSVTTSSDSRISASGRIFRKSKIDELPQLLNVLFGQMSFVGPRPDVPGFADLLAADDAIILSVRPGITGPATIKYKNEEQLLSLQPDPEQYNREVVFPDKVRINREYVESYSFCKDIYYILKTVFK